MKKFKLQSVKPHQSLKIDQTKGTEQKLQPAKKVSDKKSQQQAKKKQQLQKQMDMLAAKIEQANGNIQQTSKMLDIDLFLKKQKEKRVEYASKLNEEYDHQKKQRQEKLYKQFNRTGTQKLSATAIKSEIPLMVISALNRVKQNGNSLNEWILDGHHHKLDQMLLDTSKNEMFGDPLKTQEEKYLIQNKSNSWKPARQLSSDCSKIKYFPVLIAENQLQPSDFGEALMAALTLMPKNNSQYLYQQCDSIDKEIYFICRLYPGGQHKTIITNSWIQVRQFTHKFINVNSRHRDGFTFWSSIIQKCYKKLYFQQILSHSLFDAIQIVYGIDPEIIPFNNKVSIRQNVPKVLSSLINYKQRGMIGFINDKSATNFRVFPLIKVEYPPPKISKKKKKNKQQEDRIQNQQKKDILYHLCNPYAATILKSTFVNKFTITQLFQTFNKIVVLREYPAKWAGCRVKVQFLSNGPLSFTGSDWTKNNQYSFTITKSTNIRLILRRKWGSFTENNQQKDEDKLIFGFILFKSLEGQTQISCMRLDGLIFKGKSTQDNAASYCGKLQKGTYILIPYSHLISQQYTQSFNLDILLQKQEILSINKAKISQYYYQNTPANDEKVIQKLQSRIKYEKPKNQKIAPPKLIMDNNEKVLTIEDLQNLNLALMNGVTLEDYFIPGKLKSLMINSEQKEQKKQKIIKKSAQSAEIQKYEKQEALKILLGYDVLMEEDLNQGQMLSIIQQTTDQIDMSNFGLGEQGLMGLIEPLMSLPRLTKLNFALNDLNDSSVTYLCYYLQKGNRKQLKELDLTGNNQIGKNGIKALKGLKNTFPSLNIIGVKL